jgi:hypothetical protein
MSGISLPLGPEDFEQARAESDAFALREVEAGRDPFAPVQGFGECGVCGVWVEGPAYRDQFDVPQMGRNPETGDFEVYAWLLVRCADHKLDDEAES